MAQTTEGAIKVAAKYYGLPVEEYLERLKTQKACKFCKNWKLRIEFGKDASSVDGLAKACIECRRKKDKKSTKGRPSWFKGKQHSEEAKLQMSLARQGQGLGAKRSEETKQRISKALKGKKRPKVSGPNAYNWKGGISSVTESIRKSLEYKIWRGAVFKRDSYTCQVCWDDTGGNLHAHHTKSFAKYPELRFDIDNGITVCIRCHDLIHHKANSVRNSAKRKKRRIGITGFYKITDSGLDFLTGCNPKKAPTIIAILNNLKNTPKKIKDIYTVGKSKQAIKVALSKMRKKGLVEYEKIKG